MIDADPRTDRPAARRLRGGLLVALLVASLVTAAPIAASAAEQSPARKFGRSLANLSLGVLALPGQVAETTRERGPFVGATWGVAKGVAYVAATEVIGVFELFTAPFETPPDFKPILRPEFPWQYFTPEGQRQLRAKPPTAPPSRRTR